MSAHDAGAAAVLSLVDSRFPGGGHVHSGGVEEAVARGLVSDTAGLAALLRGRLRTTGLLVAVFAAAAAHAAHHTTTYHGTADHGVERWGDLDSELDARTPSPAQRAASRAQGRGLLRAGRSAWPSPVLDDLLMITSRPHHAVALGALAGVAGATAHDAALAAAYLSVSGPASACVRLLGLDPFQANAAVTALSSLMAEVAATAAQTAGQPPGELPAPGSPALDLFAEAHDRTHRLEVRLFAS